MSYRKQRNYRSRTGRVGVRPYNRNWPLARRTQRVHVVGHKRNWPVTGGDIPIQQWQPKPQPVEVKKPRVKRLSAKQKEAIARREADEKRYRFDDSVTYLSNYFGGTADLVVVKTFETSMDRMTRYDEPRTLVMRTRDSKLYQIGTAELVRKGIPAQEGQKFKVRPTLLDDDDQKTHLVYTK